LIQVQIDSFDWFKQEGLQELFDEINPVSDFTGRIMDLRFGQNAFGEPRYSEAECRERDLTFAAPLKVRAELLIKDTGEIKEQDIFLGDFPLMTEKGTFVINGAERVVVSQLVRSPGVYFKGDRDEGSGKWLWSAKLIPNRGAWLEFETSNRDAMYVKVDRKRKIPVTVLLRAIAAIDSQVVPADGEFGPTTPGTDEWLRALYGKVTEGARYPSLDATIERDPTKSKEEALIELYRRLRPGDPPTESNARSLLSSLLFDSRRYDLARVGRYKLTAKWDHLELEVDPRVRQENLRTVTGRDIVNIVSNMIRLNNSQNREYSDDIDHLGNRRVRAVGELIQNQFRVGLLRMERVMKERMSIQDAESATPNALINIRPVVAAMREFFGGSQLSQFMDQVNAMAEVNHKRRLSALGPGGLSRERAGFDVRDVHHSHYGRICPIETPEGPNIGLIGQLATYARINSYGFIETPYRKVVHRFRNPEPAQLVGYTLREDVTGSNGDEPIPAGTLITEDVAARIAAMGAPEVRVRPRVVDEVEYLSADREELYTVAQANSPLDEEGHFLDERVEARAGGGRFVLVPPYQVDYIDASPKQVVSIATALIPFLEHDDANRALMGANMQRQAVPLLVPDSPVVGTGVELQVAKDSGQVIVAENEGEVLRVSPVHSDPSDHLSPLNYRIVVREDDGNIREYRLEKFVRSNQDTFLNQRPIVERGDRVRKGQVIADSASTDKGELALGQNVLVAFMPWEGGNFEDAVIISDRLVKDDVFTSIHIEKYEVEARDTKLGPEEITRDIPNVGDDSLQNLDERGIVYIGAEVKPNDILVGKITPKGETELTAEERLLRAIFAEKAREVRDTSLRVPNGVRGQIIDVKVFTRDNNDELPAGVNQMVRVYIAQKRKISEGDKVAGRHGNKGVISRILPQEDMPYLPDGTPVDIILNPIGVPSRMNLGQILETHLGWAARSLGFKVASPVFDGASEQTIHEELETAGLPADGKVELYDGRTGEKFDRPVTVGVIYILKLAHLVEDKIHARSTGPYSLVTQQPLGGKAQFGGQRFGEMEVWALEAYGAAHTLQEMLTVKSDDVVGRVKTYEAIVKGEEITGAGVPESFKVLVKELQSLGLSVDVLNEDQAPVSIAGDGQGDFVPDLYIDLSHPERGEL
ncbi:MAG: DNA-directed RNA polymerase subunit beta, partial [Chloroflexota bacterium]|nr:DNA-directed RNA polymerase subunit beta [Chloroflexota bacterium]